MKYVYNPIKTGENIKRARKDYDMRMWELGEIIGKHLSTIGKYEQGLVEISPSVVVDIANALEVLPQDLLVFEVTEEDWR